MLHKPQFGIYIPNYTKYIPNIYTKYIYPVKEEMWTNIKRAKNIHIVHKRANSNYDSKVVWSVTNKEVKSHHSSQIIKLRENNIALEDNQLKANTFNEYFTNMCDTFPTHYNGKSDLKNIGHVEYVST